MVWIVHWASGIEYRASKGILGFYVGHWCHVGHRSVTGGPFYYTGRQPPFVPLARYSYMASAAAILWDYQDNVINRMQLPIFFCISGKGNKSTKPQKAQKRAVRGMSAQQHSSYSLSTPLIP